MKRTMPGDAAAAKQARLDKKDRDAAEAKQARLDKKDRDAAEAKGRAFAKVPAKR